MAQGSGASGEAENRLRPQGAGIWLAGRDAALSLARARPVGAAEQPAGWPDSAGGFLPAPGRAGAPAWVHQEDPKDPAAGDRAGLETDERDGTMMETGQGKAGSTL